jgi:hypothetical protein
MKSSAKTSSRNRIVIEVRGGCLVAVHADIPGLDVRLVDWDEVHGGEDTGFSFATESLRDLAPDTRAIIEARDQDAAGQSVGGVRA